MNKTITLTYNSSKDFSSYLASPDNNLKHPGLIVIHEVWGLNDHTKDVANRFAHEGLIVLAPDLLSETGITEKVDQSILDEIADPLRKDEAQKKLRAAYAPLNAPEFALETVEKLKSCVSYLLNDPLCSGKIAVVGYCFGGTYAFSLATEDKRVNAAVVYYGHSPSVERLSAITSPILAFYGEEDTMLVDALPELEKVMKENHKDFSYKVYKNTGHAFFNDTNKNKYNKEAAEDSWKQTLAFLHKHLASN